MPRWLLIDSGPCEFAFNMAMDEALLEGVSTLGAPVLRFYSWCEKAASFGYFQKIADIERVTHLRPLVRRPTGGGLVPHDADWTYSIAVPPSDPWYELRATESYERAHRWIQRAFARLGIATELAPSCRKEMPGQCFVGHEQFDVLWCGRKIAGAAQRRTKSGLLIQGSLQPQPSGVDREEWQRAMCDVAASDWSVVWEPKVVVSLSDHANSLADSKYRRDEYNRRR